MSDPGELSKRERQIMDILYASRGGTATSVLAALPDPPSRTAVRTLLTILERKGHLTHTKAGREFVYQPVKRHAQAARSALRRVLNTFFAGSLEGAVMAGLADPSARPTDEELARIAVLIEQAKRRR